MVGNSGDAEIFPSKLGPTQNAEDLDKGDSDSDGDDPNLYEARVESMNVEIERAGDFFRNSEALEEFREGLLDFRVGLENARQNKTNHAHPVKVECPVEAGENDGNPQIHHRSTWSQNIEKLRKALRPSVKPFGRRIEWTCVSKNLRISTSLVG